MKSGVLEWRGTREKKRGGRGGNGEGEGGGGGRGRSWGEEGEEEGTFNITTTGFVLTTETVLHHVVDSR